jgi:hypothetical protein
VNRCRDAVRRTSRARSSARPWLRPRFGPLLFSASSWGPRSVSAGAARPIFHRRASFAAPKLSQAWLRVRARLSSRALAPQLYRVVFGKQSAEPAARRIARQGDVPGRPRHRYARQRSPRRRKCRLSRLVARPMTQSDAYRAGRGLMVRLAGGGRWRSRAVLLEGHHTKKAAHPGAKGSNGDRCCPHDAHVYTQAPRPRPQGLPSP